MTKLEQVAKAIGLGVTRGEVEPRGEWLKAARFAIEAMREPTEAMLAAPYHEGDGCDAQYMADEDFRCAWQAMIDAALAESPDK